MKLRLLIVGAGLSGAVIARHLAELGHHITVVEQRNHVAGNCHCARDAETGVLVHVYGPHIFHTDDVEVWDYVNRFAKFHPFKHRVKTISGGQVFFFAGQSSYDKPVLWHNPLAPRGCRPFGAKGR